MGNVLVAKGNCGWRLGRTDPMREDMWLYRAKRDVFLNDIVLYKDMSGTNGRETDRNKMITSHE